MNPTIHRRTRTAAVACTLIATALVSLAPAVTHASTAGPGGANVGFDFSWDDNANPAGHSASFLEADGVTANNCAGGALTPATKTCNFVFDYRIGGVPQASAAVIYMMDVSGSMGREQKEIVRIEAFWIDTWLRQQYQNLEVCYIVHDAAAHVVDQHTFFHLRESGGTKISSAYELCLQVIRDKYPANEWNVYPFHFSDGDNWSSRDTERCVELLKTSILPDVNQFCYGQVKSAYGSGQFKKDLDTALRGEDKVVTSDILDRDGILPSIKSFLGGGR